MRRAYRVWVPVQVRYAHLLLAGFLPLSAQNVMTVQDAQILPGFAFSTSILLAHDEDVQGFQTAITYDNISCAAQNGEYG